jgi:hypothetical protein
MKYAKHISSFLFLALSLLILTACGQKSNCSGISFGDGTGGTAGGGLSGAGSACGPGSGNGGSGSATDLLYYLGGGTVIDAASVTSSSFANVAGYTPVAFPNGTQLGLNFGIASKKFLYVPIIESTGGAVLGYTINRGTAALTPIGSSSFATSTVSADMVASDPQGRFLYVADTSHGNIAVFKIDAGTGVLTASGSPVHAGGGPSQMTVDGTGNYLYFPSSGSIYGFSIDQTSGTLTALPNSPFNVHMDALQADSAGKYLFGTSGFGDTNVYVVPIGVGTGSLGVPTGFPTIQAPGSVALSPTGKVLFTFSVDSAFRPLPIEGFTFDATTGIITEMSASPFINLPKVNTGLFDQTGGTLLGVTTTSFFVYSIDATGTPTSPIPSLGTAHDERYAFTN